MKPRQIAELHAKTHIYQARLYTARRVTFAALQTGAGWYVGFSGGKDSTVVADLVSGFAPATPLLYGDEEWLLPETAAYLQRVQTANPDRFHRIKAADTHAAWFSVWQDAPEAIRSDNASGVYARQQGWGGCFLGLRQEENSRRFLMLKKLGALFFSQKDQVWLCNPLYNWTWRDVWAYIYTHEIDYNRAYDRLDEIGIDPTNQRIGPLAQELVLGYGQLAILKRGWPEVFNRFAAQYPEASLYT